MAEIALLGPILSVIGGAGTLIYRVTTFTLELKAARKDMDAVLRELISLKICLEIISNDSNIRRLPEARKQEVLSILVSCENLFNQIKKALHKLESAPLARIRWSAFDKSEVNGYRSALESHKKALDIALSAISLAACLQQQMTIESTDQKVGQIDRKQDYYFRQLQEEFHAFRIEMRSYWSVPANHQTLAGGFAKSMESYVTETAEPVREANPDGWAKFIQPIQNANSDRVLQALSIKINSPDDNDVQQVSTQAVDLRDVAENENDVQEQEENSHTIKLMVDSRSRTDPIADLSHGRTVTSGLTIVRAPEPRPKALPLAGFVVSREKSTGYSIRFRLRAFADQTVTYTGEEYFSSPPTELQSLLDGLSELLRANDVMSSDNEKRHQSGETIAYPYYSDTVKIYEFEADLSSLLAYVSVIWGGSLYRNEEWGVTADHAFLQHAPLRPDPMATGPLSWFMNPQSSFSEYNIKDGDHVWVMILPRNCPRPDTLSEEAMRVFDLSAMRVPSNIPNVRLSMIQAY